MTVKSIIRRLIYTTPVHVPDGIAPRRLPGGRTLCIPMRARLTAMRQSRADHIAVRREPTFSTRGRLYRASGPSVLDEPVTCRLYQKDGQASRAYPGVAPQDHRPINESGQKARATGPDHLAAAEGSLLAFHRTITYVLLRAIEQASLYFVALNGHGGHTTSASGTMNGRAGTRLLPPWLSPARPFAFESAWSGTPGTRCPRREDVRASAEGRRPRTDWCRGSCGARRSCRRRPR